MLLFLFSFLSISTQTDRSDTDSADEAGFPFGTTDFDDYLWPTDAGHVITSTFAEYRRAHFHGGIDVSTGNDTGFLIFASRDGYVSRIIVSPDGYGKMLFVRHPDQFSTTYAHLRNFAPEIDERVRLEQTERGVYPVSIQCGPNEFPVRKGDVIAYSGETGAGSPHLHFEIRDPDNDFVNPLQCTSFPNIDSIRPTIRRLAVSPIGSESSVDGSWSVRTYPVRQGSPGSYSIPEPIHIRGAAGFAIDVRDKSEQTYYRQGVHSLDFTVDDRIFYSVALNSAPSTNSHESGLYYDWELADAGLGRFQRLYTTQFPNSLSFYTPQRDSAGFISLSRFDAGKHRFSIRITDRGGNSCELSGTFIVDQIPEISATMEDTSLTVSFTPAEAVRFAHISTRNRNSGKWTNSVKPLIEFGNPLAINTLDLDMVRVTAESEWGGKSVPQVFDINPDQKGEGTLTVDHEILNGFVRLHIRTEGNLRSSPRLTLYEGTLQRDISIQPIEANHFVGTFVPDDTIGGLRRAVAAIGTGKTVVTAVDEFELYPIRTGRSGTYFADGGNLILSYDSASVLSTVFVEVVPGTFEEEKTYRLEPTHTVLNKGILVSMRADSVPGNSGLMLRTRTGWKLLARQSTLRNGMLTGRITQMLGEVGIISDSTPPILTGLRIRQSRQAYPHISVRFDDSFAGIEYNEFKMYIDDQPVIPEIDGEHNRAVYQPSQPLSKGPHQLLIRVMDRFGNSRELRNQFSVR